MEQENQTAETPKVSTSTKVKGIAIIIVAIIMYTIGFFVGWADRFICAFLPWEEMPKLTSQKFYTEKLFYSFLRVVVCMLIATLVWYLFF